MDICALCERRPTTKRHWCDYCLARDEMLYHGRSIKQTRMWKREIFTDDEFDIDSMIQYHIDQYNGLKILTERLKEKLG